MAYTVGEHLRGRYRRPRKQGSGHGVDKGGVGWRGLEGMTWACGGAIQVFPKPYLGQGERPTDGIQERGGVRDVDEKAGALSTAQRESWRGSRRHVDQFEHRSNPQNTV